MSEYAHINSINTKLVKFSWMHYTNINQIFGDLEVRDIIEHVFPNDKIGFEHYTDEEFGFHHYVYDKYTLNTTCSIGEKVQDTSVNVNDNLCATYSILAYFGVPFVADPMENQMNMIRVCRKIINNKRFVASVKAAILTDPQERKRWEIYNRVTEKSRERAYHVNMDPVAFWEKIRGVLDEWEEFGHIFFIGDGTH